METQQTQQQTFQASVETVSPFDEGSWQQTPNQPATPAVTPTEGEPKEETTAPAETPVAPAFDFKTEFGWDSPEDGKKELEELRALKNKPSDIAFENEESRRAFDLVRQGKKKEFYEYLRQELELSELETLEVSDIKNAEKIIKTNFRYKYKDLTTDEVDDMFYETYEKPAKPQQATDELDEEYQQRLDKWTLQCANIDKRMIRDAKLARPEITSHKTQIKFPEIDKKEEASDQAPTPEELAKFEKMQKSFLETAESHVSSLQPLSVTVKDKDVELPLAYSYSQEEKTTLSNAMNQLAESGFNANALLAQRWVNEDKTFNTPQIAKDLLMIFNGEKAVQKLASDAANERLKAYLKDKKQISVNETDITGQFTPAGEKTEQEEVREFFWSQQ